MAYRRRRRKRTTKVNARKRGAQVRGGVYKLGGGFLSEMFLGKNALTKLLPI